MAEKVELEVELQDDVSAPAKRAAAAIDATTKSIAKMQATAGKAKGVMDGIFQDKNGRWRASNGRFLSSTEKQEMGLEKADGFFASMMKANLATKGVEYALAGVKMALQAAVSAAASFASSIVKAFDFRRQAELSLGVLTKGSGSAALARVTSIARELGQSTESVTTQMRGLLGAGFSEGDASKFIRGLADIKALGATDEGISGMVMAIGQIKGKGVLSAEEINQIAENSGGLVGRGKIYEAIAKAKGISTQEAMKLGNLGKISGDDGVAAILTAIQQTSGTELGQLGASAASKTFSGAMAKMDALRATFFDKLATRAAPALEGALMAISAAADSAFKWLDSAEGVSFMGGISDAVTEVIGLFRSMGPAVMSFVRGFVGAFGPVGGALLDNTSALASIFSSPEFIESARMMGGHIGMVTAGLIGLGQIAVGLVSYIGAPFTAMSGAINVATTAVQNLFSWLSKLSAFSWIGSLFGGGGGAAAPAGPSASAPTVFAPTPYGGASMPMMLPMPSMAPPAPMAGPQPSDFTTSRLAQAAVMGPTSNTNNNWTNSFSINVTGGGDDNLAAKISRAVRSEFQNMTAAMGV